MAMDAENKPWIQLAGALGRLLRHILEDRASQNASINIVTRGKLSSLGFNSITAVRQLQLNNRRLCR